MKYFRLLAVLAFALAAVSAAAQNIANGQSVYNNICRGCHGFPPAGGPDRAANNPGLIQNALNGGVPAMTILRPIVSNADTVDIAAWLATLSSPGPTEPAVPAFDFTDLWWNPTESGWGLNLIQHPSHVIFGVMYTYDLSGRPLWLVLPSGTWLTPLTYSGAFYRVSGPPFNRATFDSTAIRPEEVGTATITFSGRDAGTLVFTFNGVQVTKLIARQPF